MRRLLLLPAFLLTALIAPTTAGAAPPPGCTEGLPGGKTTCEFTTPGTHPFPVTEGRPLYFDIRGAGGGLPVGAEAALNAGCGGVFRSFCGGYGARVKGIFVSPALDGTYFVTVGGAGGRPQGGVNGGGDGGSVHDGGGGGATDIRFENNTLGERAAIAAGGGGYGSTRSLPASSDNFECELNEPPDSRPLYCGSGGDGDGRGFRGRSMNVGDNPWYAVGGYGGGAGTSTSTGSGSGGSGGDGGPAGGGHGCAGGWGTYAVGGTGGRCSSGRYGGGGGGGGLYGGGGGGGGGTVGDGHPTSGSVAGNGGGGGGSSFTLPGGTIVPGGAGSPMGKHGRAQISWYEDGATITSPRPLDATAGRAFSYKYTALTGPTFPPTEPSFLGTGASVPTFKVIDGGLPPGLTLAADGTLSGIPTAQGAYEFAVEAAGDAANPSSKTHRWENMVVYPNSDAPPAPPVDPKPPVNSKPPVDPKKPAYVIKTATPNPDGTVTLTLVPVDGGTGELVITVPTASLAGGATAGSAAKQKRCKRGKVRIRGKCRPKYTVVGRARGKGRKAVPLVLKARPNKALRSLLKRRKVKVRTTLTYTPTGGKKQMIATKTVTLKRKRR